MDLETVREKLNDIDSDELRAFILELYMGQPELADRIEAMLLASDPKALKSALKQRIKSLRNSQRFVDYRHSFDFGLELEGMISDIERLIPTDPRCALDLIEQFLGTAESVLNRVDDSGGSVGDGYRTAAEAWLTAASAIGSSGEDWVDRIYRLYESNDYGLLDDLLPNADKVLSEVQLRQLASRYEIEFRQALLEREDDPKSRYRPLHLQVALQSVAQALKDSSLYEYALRIVSPEPNELQLEAICKCHLRFGKPEVALALLERPWSLRFASNRLDLLDKAYQATGDVAAQKSVRYERFKTIPSVHEFEKYTSLLDEEELRAARAEAVTIAEANGCLMSAAELLICLGEVEQAQSIILTRVNELDGNRYYQLPELAEQLVQVGCALAATACYRALLSSILDEGRSKAYGYAARYVKSLKLLASGINDFSPLKSHDDFMLALQEIHGRKRSFWARL